MTSPDYTAIIDHQASTHAAIDRLAQGKTHLAGLHLHNRAGEEANVAFARRKLRQTDALIMGFSFMEEGLMVSRGNPLNIGPQPTWPSRYSVCQPGTLGGPARTPG